MDGNNAPCTLDAELFEECGSHDPLIRDECVRVEKCAAHNADYNDAETPAESLAQISDRCTTSESTQIGDYLGYGNGISGEIELILEKSRVQILGAVGLGDVRNRVPLYRANRM